MKRLISIFAALSLAVFGLSASATDGFTYTGIGTPALAPGGLTVTLNSLQIVEKSGSTQLVINYSQKNNTADKKLDEGQFKLFFTDGTSEPQYGFFNSFFPGDGNTRSYTWEWLKGKEPWLIEWEAGFFTAKPTATGLKWKVGSNFPSATPAPSPTPTPTAGPSQPELAFEFKASNYNPANGQWTNTSGASSPIITRSVASGVTFPAKGSAPDSVEFNGRANGFQFITTQQSENPQDFSLDVWFRTTGTGKLIGFESSTNPTSSEHYDRHLYVGSDGRLHFGIWTGTAQLLSTGKALNDGLWHQAIATFSQGTSSLYVDGALVDSRRVGSAWNGSGYWRLGGNRLSGWPSGSDGFFAGSIGEARIYNRAVSAVEVSNSYSQKRVTYLSTPTPTPSATPSPEPTFQPISPEVPPRVTLRWTGDILNFSAQGLWLKGDQLIIRVGASIVWSRNTSGRASVNFKLNTVPPQAGMTWESGYFDAEQFVPNRFSSCQQVWKVFDGGIRNAKTSVNKGARAIKTPTTWPQGHQLSKKLDIDKDGIVCER